MPNYTAEIVWKKSDQWALCRATKRGNVEEKIASQIAPGVSEYASLFTGWHVPIDPPTLLIGWHA